MNKDIKFNLRQARTYAGFTQDEIAKQLGISKLAYQHYENEKKQNKMRIDKAEKFSKIVKIPITRIIF